MKREWILAGLALLVAVAWNTSGVFSQSQNPYGIATAAPSAWYSAVPQVAANGSLLLSSSITPQGLHQISVIDSQAKSLAVYHVQPDSGQVILKSVRNITADFGLDEFNGSDPSPSKVRAIQK